MQQIPIDESEAGKRADVVAAENLPDLSRAYVQKLFESGKIRLDKTTIKPGHKLRLGETLQIEFDSAELENIPGIDLPIIYEDDDVLVIDKPPGVISHARGKFWNEPSVASFVRQRISGSPNRSHLEATKGDLEARTESYQKYGGGSLERPTQRSAESGSRVSGSARKQADTMQRFGGERAGIVHRLDRVTSGVMICAKNQQSLSFLQKQFSQRKTKKIYIAIVSGHLKPDSAIIDMPLERSPVKPQTFRAGSNGKEARTKYTVEKSLNGFDVVRLEPETGRTHQLRVHLHEVGHPIVGDHLYSGIDASRLFLHAQSLELTLPGGERKVFTSPVPVEFEQFEAQHG